MGYVKTLTMDFAPDRPWIEAVLWLLSGVDIVFGLQASAVETK